MKYKVIVSGEFSSTHRVRLPSGEWEQYHEHNYKVEVCVSGDTLDRNGMLVEFSEVKRHLDSVISSFEGVNLNEVLGKRGLMPTAESLAELIFLEISERVSYKVDYVRLYETDEFSVVVSSE